MNIEIVLVDENNQSLLFLADSTFGHAELLQKEDTLYCYLGVGKQSLSFEDVRLLGGTARKKLSIVGDAEVGIQFDPLMKQAPELDGEQVISCFMEGWHMAAYQFTAYKKDAKPLSNLEIKLEADEQFSACNQAAKNKAEAVHFARDLCNEPANKLTPALYASRLREAFSNTDVQVEIIEGEALDPQEFAGIHTVAKGSSNAPKLAVLTLNRSDDESIALVGKGVTFDSGGTNVKTARDISDMKMDMGGSAAVAGAMKLLASSGSRVNATAILPLVQNLADGNAMLPSDVITYRNGLTVEVGNTDAEGRLILADGILYAEKLGITKIVDIATLTGSVMRALGEKAAGIFSNDEAALWNYKNLGDQSGDFVWPMPIYDEYLEYLKTDVADVNNMSSSPLGGSIAAALFLKQFVNDDAKWVHIDMAGTMEPRKVHSYYTPGASGYGVRLLYEMVLSEAGIK